MKAREECRGTEGTEVRVGRSGAVAEAWDGAFEVAQGKPCDAQDNVRAGDNRMISRERGKLEWEWS